MAIHALTKGTKVSTAACSVIQHQQHLAIRLVQTFDLDTFPSRLTIYSGAKWLPILPNQCTCIVIEFHDHSIFSLIFLGRPNYDGVSDVSSSHSVCCSGRCTAGAAVAHGARLLYDDYDAITLGTSVGQRYMFTYQYGSPILPCLFIRKFATHSTIVAPELSMQFSIV